MPILPATPAAITRAAQWLREGRVVGLPTETAYGLPADAANADGLPAINLGKGRPADHPLIVHVIDLEQATGWA